MRTAIGLVGALSVATSLAAPVVDAQTTTPPSPEYFPITVLDNNNIQDQGRYAERTRVADDLDKDGVKDIWMGQPGFKRNDKPYGRVHAYSGASLADPQGNKDKPKTLYEIHYPEPQEGKQFGFWVEALGDVNADGYTDVAVGTDAQDVPIDVTRNSQRCTQPPDPEPNDCRENMGKLWVFDGRDNKILYELVNPRPQGSEDHNARFGSRIGRAGDVNGNGVPDLIVGASGNDNPEAPGCSDDGVAEPGCRRMQGQAFIFEGSNGALIRELNLPKSDENPPTTCQDLCGSFGISVQGPGDVDRDGVPDQTVGAASLGVGSNQGQGRMYVFSGATGQVIRRIDDPEPHPLAFFGFQDVTPRDPGDVNQDGAADVYAMGFFQNGEGGAEQGKSWVFNTGAGNELFTPVLYELQNPNRKAGQQFGWSMTRDRNRQRPADQGDDEDPVSNPVYVGNAPHHLPGNPDQRGETNTFNAATGAHVHTLPLPPPWNTEGGQFRNLGPNLGWNVSSPGDLNRDGFRDFLAGAPFTDVCDVILGTTNKKLMRNAGVLIVFRSLPTGEIVNPGNHNPADNQCEPPNNS